MWCVTWRKTTIAITALAFVAAMGAFTLVQKQFFPTANRPELIVDLKAGPGRVVGRHRPRSAAPGEVAGREPRRRLLHVLRRRRQPALLPADRAGTLQRELRSGHRHDQGLAARERVVAELNKLFANGFEAVRARVQRLQNGPPVSYPVMFRVLGDDPQQVRTVAEKVRQVFKADPATRDINSTGTSSPRPCGSRSTRTKRAPSVSIRSF